MAGLGLRLLFLPVAIAAQAAQTPQELFDKLRLNVVRNLERMPKYTCVQRQERKVFEEFGRWWKSCDALAEERGKHERGGLRLTSKQRFQLEVAVSDSKEVFSWPGGEAFETDEVKKAMQQGISGMGDFGAFLSGIFMNNGVNVKYLGETPADRWPNSAIAYRWNPATTLTSTPRARPSSAIKGPSGPTRLPHCCKR